jgi:hypothetical protein
MSYSEEKDQGTPGQKIAPTVTEEIVKKPTGELVKVVRGAGGKFQKQKKTMPKSEDMTRLIRNLLAQPMAGPDGKMRRGDISRARMILDNIVAIAAESPHQVVLDKFGHPIMLTDEHGDQRPMTTFDAKAAMSSTQAFKELWLRGYGMPSKSDEELEAQKMHGVKIVILQHPEMMNKEVVEDKPKAALEPAFAEVTEITTNPKQDSDATKKDS